MMIARTALARSDTSFCHHLTKQNQPRRGVEKNIHHSNSVDDAARRTTRMLDEQFLCSRHHPLGATTGDTTLVAPAPITLKSQIEKEVLDTMLEKENDQCCMCRVLHFLSTTGDDNDDVCDSSRLTRTIDTVDQQETKGNTTTTSSTTSSGSGLDEQKNHSFLSHSPVTVAASKTGSSHDKNKEQEHRFLDSMMGNVERFEICKWYYTVVDYYSFDRITVTIAMSFMDRVLWKKASRLVLEGSVDTSTNSLDSRTKDDLQLLAVASLYLAIKLFEKHNHIHEMLFDFVLMSKGKFSANEITGMESYILKELEWNVLHKPMPQQFLHHVMKLACLSYPGMSKASARQIMNHANYFIEVVVFDNSFAKVHASVIASAALLISVKLTNDAYASYAVRATLDNTVMTRKPLSSHSSCGCMSIMSRLEFILHVMANMDAFTTKHLQL